ncbi:MAG: OmpA family protein [Bryobacterales bacterium]|nr:OmpA family protein [Bryobacterales bacterium]MBV9399714.1 OmpA family protein [Bryobacterales bacterium]
MKTLTLTAGALALVLAGTGCATKKYVAKTVAPVESRVGATETKNGEQDKALDEHNRALAEHKKELDDIGTDLSRTKERVTDVDGKATQAGQAAQQANQAAQQANQAAGNAQKSADGAKTFAEEGINRLDKTMTAMNKWDLSNSVTVLFPLGQSNLTKDAKQQLDDFAQGVGGFERYQIEVQGFTDKSGPAMVNDSLSQARAAAVARYLTNEHKIPVRSVSTLGSGWATPVADDKTREGRKQNRRVEVRLYVPEAGAKTVAAAGAGQ